MITVEAVVISVFGALLGVGGRRRARRGGGPGAARRGHHRPGAAVGADGHLTSALAALVGVVAAVLPAIRAARLNVLGAIAHD